MTTHEHPSENSSKYLNYPSRPIILGAERAFSSGILSKKRNVVTLLPTEDMKGILTKPKYTFSPDRQFDLVEATLFGLNESLVRTEGGDSLREEFESRKIFYERALRNNGDYSQVGTYVFYPDRNHLVHYTDRDMHRLLLVASNSKLYLDPEMSLNWQQMRQHLENKVVAIAGASVGNSVAHAVSMVLRPNAMKIADLNPFKPTNANRVRLGYDDVVWPESERGKYGLLMKNKAVGAASQIHRIDPFMDIYAYYDGINGTNANMFVSGNSIEPRSNFVVEVTDDPDAKIAIREAARTARVRLVMVTDAGSSVQIDIRAFDKDPDATLSYGVTDQELYRSQEVYKRDSSRDTFFSFVDRLIGTEYRNDNTEFGRLVTGRIPRLFANIEQSGATVSRAGGYAAELIARMSLGHQYRERCVIDLLTMQMKSWGDFV